MQAAHGDGVSSALLTPEKPIKPTMRGVIHHWAAVLTLGAGLVLVATAPSRRAALAATLYMLSVVTLFGVSAVYHRPTWTPTKRAFMRRLDHAAIFVLIAGTYTPICLLGIPDPTGTKLLTAVWLGALAGVFQSVFWVHAPKPVTALIYLFVGWTIVPYVGAVRAALTTTQCALMLGGGLVYSLGAVVYAVRKPNIVKNVFGYHEVFHALTLIACAMHFALVLQLVQASR